MFPLHRKSRCLRSQPASGSAASREGRENAPAVVPNFRPENFSENCRRRPTAQLGLARHGGSAVRRHVVCAARRSGTTQRVSSRVGPKVLLCAQPLARPNSQSSLLMQPGEDAGDVGIEGEGVVMDELAAVDLEPGRRGVGGDAVVEIGNDLLHGRPALLERQPGSMPRPDRPLSAVPLRGRRRLALSPRLGVLPCRVG